jgi:hypothetical protein
MFDREFFKEFGLFIGLIASAVGVSVGALIMYSSYQCDVYSEVTKLETKFVGQMCFIKSGDSFVPYEEYKLRNITHN